jgi:tellurite resistance protein TerC
LNSPTGADIQFSTASWVVFNLFVLAMLTLDLGVFNRKAHVIRFKEALGWTIFWVTLALGFNGWLYFEFGPEIGHEFLAGYLLEKSLSVDNIFVFVTLFTYFNVAPKYQHRLLFWGILGALVLRGAMIASGAALIHRFDWILYVFGVLLIITGIKMAIHDPAEADPSRGIVYRLAKRFLPLADGDYGQKFFVKQNGKTYVTTLFIVLLVVETTDVLFAIDSIPAVFAVTENPFIIYTSNVFAILGLRALYFLLAGVMDMFRYLKYGLALVLGFVGVKMLLGHTDYKIPIHLSLIIIGVILALSIIISLMVARHEDKVAGKEGYEPEQLPGSKDWPDEEASEYYKRREQAKLNEKDR